MYIILRAFSLYVIIINVCKFNEKLSSSFYSGYVEWVASLITLRTQIQTWLDYIFKHYVNAS